MPDRVHQRPGSQGSDPPGIAHDPGMDIAHAVLIEITEGKGLEMIEGSGAQIPVNGNLRGHGSPAGDIIHDGGKQNGADIQNNIPGKRIHRIAGNKMIQGIALEQRQDDIHRTAPQAAEDHQDQRFPVHPDIGHDQRNAEETQTFPVPRTAFLSGGHFHDSFTSSRCMD